MLESLCNKVADLQTCNVIKKRHQRRCFPMNTVVNIAKSLRTPFLTIIWQRLLLPLEVFCIKTLLISTMRMLHLTYQKTIWLQLIYFLTTVAFGLMKYRLWIDGNNLRVLVKDFILYSIYGSNQSLWEIHGIASINFDCFTIDESKQVKISRKIMQCQGYFF